MERLLISQLLKWKDSHGRKPLIQEGARQVGSHQSLAIREKQQFKNHQHRKHPTPMTIQLHPQCLLGIQSILQFSAERVVTITTVQ